jgi:hypothetical protein
MLTKEVLLLSVFLLLLFFSVSATTAPLDITALNKLMVCQSACVDEMDACLVSLEPKCKNVKDKSACYEPCNAAYTACLGECAKIAPDFGSLPTPK